MPEANNNNALDINNNIINVETNAKLALTDADIPAATKNLITTIKKESPEAVKTFLDRYDDETQRKIIAGRAGKGSIFCELANFYRAPEKPQHADDILPLLLKPFEGDKYNEDLFAILSKKRSRHSFEKGTIFQITSFLSPSCANFFKLIVKRIGPDTTYKLLSRKNNDSENALHRICRNDVLKSDKVSANWRSEVFHAFVDGLPQEQKAKLLLSKETDGQNVLQFAFATVRGIDRELVCIKDIMECLTLKQKKEAILNKDNDGESVLFTAIGNGNNKAVKALLGYLPREERVPILKQVLAGFKGSEINSDTDSQVDLDDIEKFKKFVDQYIAKTQFTAQIQSIAPKTLGTIIYTVGTACFVAGLVLEKYPEIVKPQICHALMVTGTVCIVASMALGMTLFLRLPSTELQNFVAQKVEGVETAPSINS